MINCGFAGGGGADVFAFAETPWAAGHITDFGSGDAVDLPALALDLGYFDQPHFIRDFKSQVGRTPAQYAKQCASRASGA